MPIMPSRPQSKYSCLDLSPEHVGSNLKTSITPRAVFNRFRPNTKIPAEIKTFQENKPEVKVYFDSIEDEKQMAAGNLPCTQFCESNLQPATKRKSFPFFLKNINSKKVSLDSSVQPSQADPEANPTFSPKRPTLKQSSLSETNQPFANLLRRIRSKDSFSRLDDDSPRH